MHLVRVGKFVINMSQVLWVKFNDRSATVFFGNHANSMEFNTQLEIDALRKAFGVAE